VDVELVGRDVFTPRVATIKHLARFKDLGIVAGFGGAYRGIRDMYLVEALEDVELESENVTGQTARRVGQPVRDDGLVVGMVGDIGAWRRHVVVLYGVVVESSVHWVSGSFHVLGYRFTMPVGHFVSMPGTFAFVVQVLCGSARSFKFAPAVWGCEVLVNVSGGVFDMTHNEC